MWSTMMKNEAMADLENRKGYTVPSMGLSYLISRRSPLLKFEVDKISSFTMTPRSIT